RALGESVDSGGARAARSGHAGEGEREIKRFAGDERELDDLPSGDSGVDGRGLRLQYRGRRFDGDDLGLRSDFEAELNARWDAGIHLDVGDGRGLEALGGRGDVVGSGAERGYVERAVGAADGAVDSAGLDVSDGDVGTGNEAARGVGDGAGEWCGCG